MAEHCTLRVPSGTGRVRQVAALQILTLALVDFELHPEDYAHAEDTSLV